MLCGPAHTSAHEVSRAAAGAVAVHVRGGAEAVGGQSSRRWLTEERYLSTWGIACSGGAGQGVALREGDTSAHEVSRAATQLVGVGALVVMLGEWRAGSGVPVGGQSIRRYLSTWGIACGGRARGGARVRRH